MTKKKKIILLSISCALLAVTGLLFYTLDSYVAAGCGICGGGGRPDITFTFNPSAVIAADQNMSNAYDCRFAGCTFGTKYYFFNFKKIIE